jgi:hypothetical protein
MAKFARPNSYTGKQSNRNWTGDTRAATVNEVAAGDSDQLYISPLTLATAIATLLPIASETQRGIIEIATQTETNTGTDDLRAITPLKLKTNLTTPPPIGGTTPNTGAFSTLSATSTIVAGTTLTATLGAVTATNGNLVASTAGTGLLLNSGAATGAAASPVVLNARSGQVVFTSVSIAAAADLTLTITNSAITASTTQVICDVSGATTGAALSVKSKTSSTGSLALVITNGTGATTTTADITVTFLVVNA